MAKTGTEHNVNRSAEKYGDSVAHVTRSHIHKPYWKDINPLWSHSQHSNYRANNPWLQNIQGQTLHCHMFTTSLRSWKKGFLPALGLVLGAAVPDCFDILLGTLIPLGLAVLMFPPVISESNKACVRQRVQTDPRPWKQMAAALRRRSCSLRTKINLTKKK